MRSRPMVADGNSLRKPVFKPLFLIPRLLYWSRDFPHLPSSKDPRELATK